MDFLKKIEARVSREGRKIYERIFEIREIELNLKNFKNFPEFQKQNIIFIRDKVLSTETVFNFSRKKRPLPLTEIKTEIKSDPFCAVEEQTPIDEVGRLENESAITAANLSKMADYHSLIIFKKHKFEELIQNDFLGALDLAADWFKKIKELDPEILTQILIWNYHYRAGASILHPHFQVLAYKEIPQKIKLWQEKVENYQKEFGSNYLEDYFNLLQEVGLAKKDENLKVWLSLTPFKEKTLFFHGDIGNFWQILEKLIQSGTQSFNIFYLYSSPYFKNFGFFVDRGEINKMNSDFGALEVFGLPVVSYDPFELANLIFD